LENKALENQLLLKVEQAAERLGLGRTIVWGLVATGELESLKIGRSRRVPVEALNAYVERLRAGE
jgi:excisionase family DNA binding protein